MSRHRAHIPRPAALRLGLLVGLGAALVSLAGCGGKSSGGTSIVLYNGQHPQLTSALIAAFEKQTGITVRQRTNDSVVLADQILQEGSHSPADVYISENSPELMVLEEHGRLTNLSSSILDQVPTKDNSPKHQWVGIALRVSSLVYDPKLIANSKLPSSVLELAKPQWKGKIAIAPTDSDFPPLVGAVIATYGPKAAATWLSGLKRNAQTYQDDEAVVAAVNRGDVATGIINQYYWYRLRLEVGAGAVHSALYYFPNHDVGSITNISGAAILTSSSHLQAAEAFVKFLVGQAAQRIIAKSDDFEYPARPDVAPNRSLPPLRAIAHATLSAAVLGDDAQATKLLQKSGLF
jgi:iron(III) transport system substrate-binding protein